MTLQFSSNFAKYQDISKTEFRNQLKALTKKGLFFNRYLIATKEGGLVTTNFFKAAWETLQKRTNATLVELRIMQLLGAGSKLTEGNDLDLIKVLIQRVGLTPETKSQHPQLDQLVDQVFQSVASPQENKEELETRCADLISNYVIFHKKEFKDDDLRIAAIRHQTLPTLAAPEKRIETPVESSEEANIDSKGDDEEETGEADLGNQSEPFPNRDESTPEEQSLSTASQTTNNDHGSVDQGISIHVIPTDSQPLSGTDEDRPLADHTFESFFPEKPSANKKIERRSWKWTAFSILSIAAGIGLAVAAASQLFREARPNDPVIPTPSPDLPVPTLLTSTDAEIAMGARSLIASSRFVNEHTITPLVSEETPEGSFRVVVGNEFRGFNSPSTIAGLLPASPEKASTTYSPVNQRTSSSSAEEQPADQHDESPETENAYHAVVDTPANDPSVEEAPPQQDLAARNPLGKEECVDEVSKSVESEKKPKTSHQTAKQSDASLYKLAGVIVMLILAGFRTLLRSPPPLRRPPSISNMQEHEILDLLRSRQRDTLLFLQEQQLYKVHDKGIIQLALCVLNRLTDTLRQVPRDILAKDSVIDEVCQIIEVHKDSFKLMREDDRRDSLQRSLQQLITILPQEQQCRFLIAMVRLTSNCELLTYFNFSPCERLFMLKELGPSTVSHLAALASAKPIATIKDVLEEEQSRKLFYECLELFGMDLLACIKDSWDLDITERLIIQYKGCLNFQAKHGTVPPEYISSSISHSKDYHSLARLNDNYAVLCATLQLESMHIGEAEEKKHGDGEEAPREPKLPPIAFFPEAVSLFEKVHNKTFRPSCQQGTLSLYKNNIPILELESSMKIPDILVEALGDEAVAGMLVGLGDEVLADDEKRTAYEGVKKEKDVEAFMKWCFLKQLQRLQMEFKAEKEVSIDNFIKKTLKLWPDWKEDGGLWISVCQCTQSFWWLRQCKLDDVNQMRVIEKLGIGACTYMRHMKEALILRCVEMFGLRVLGNMTFLSKEQLSPEALVTLLVQGIVHAKKHKLDSIDHERFSNTVSRWERMQSCSLTDLQHAYVKPISQLNGQDVWMIVCHEMAHRGELAESARREGMVRTMEDMDVIKRLSTAKKLFADVDMDQVLQSLKTYVDDGGPAAVIAADEPTLMNVTKSKGQRKNRGQRKSEEKALLVLTQAQQQSADELLIAIGNLKEESQSVRTDEEFICRAFDAIGPIALRLTSQQLLREPRFAAMMVEKVVEYAKKNTVLSESAASFPRRKGGYDEDETLRALKETPPDKLFQAVLKLKNESPSVGTHAKFICRAFDEIGPAAFTLVSHDLLQEADFKATMILKMREHVEKHAPPMDPAASSAPLTQLVPFGQAEQQLRVEPASGPFMEQALRCALVEKTLRATLGQGPVLDIMLTGLWQSWLDKINFGVR